MPLFFRFPVTHTVTLTPCGCTNSQEILNLLNLLIKARKTFSYREVVRLNEKSEGLGHVKFSLFSLELIIKLRIGLLPFLKEERKEREKEKNVFIRI